MSKQPYQPVEPEHLQDINFLDQSLQNCPYRAYQLLRDEAPVWKDPITGFYVISRFEDLRKVLLDTESYSNDMSGRRPQAHDQAGLERVQRLSEPWCKDVAGG